jgi:hypothetical protein
VGNVSHREITVDLQALRTTQEGETITGYGPVGVLVKWLDINLDAVKATLEENRRAYTQHIDGRRAPNATQAVDWFNTFVTPAGLEALFRQGVIRFSGMWTIQVIASITCVCLLLPRTTTPPTSEKFDWDGDRRCSRGAKAFGAKESKESTQSIR